MALKGKTQGRWFSIFHFLLRCLGLLAVVAALVGVVLAQLPLMHDHDDSKADIIETVEQRWTKTADLVEQVASGAYAGPLVGTVAGWMILVAVPLMVLALLIELIALLAFTAGRRSLAGSLVAVQLALAVFVLVGVNFYSFQHYEKIDCTRPGPHGVGQFTLPQDVQTQLGHLRRETTIVVLQQRRQSKANEDPSEGAYVAAAEAVIVQKVRDLAEMMREFGPQFRVVVLDAKSKEFKGQLERETRNRPKLAEAIQQSPESSILFYAELDPPQNANKEPIGKPRAYVRRLGFDDFYQLDKTRSLQGDQGDLVLQEKGVQRFINCVLNIDEKRPKIGVLVVHELLTTQSNEESFSLKGMRDALTRDGYDIVDIVTARWGGPRPQPAVDTVQETKYERLTEEIQEVERERADWEKNIKGLREVIPEWKDKPAATLEKEYARMLAANRIARVTPEVRKEFIELFEREVEQQEQLIARLKKTLDGLTRDRDALNVDEASVQRRMTDNQAKLRQVIADCDMLFIPRLTIRPSGQVITYNIHRIGLDAAQAAVIKAFMTEGKPVFACFGPSNEPPRQPDPIIDRPGQDEIEQLLAELGIEFGQQTVLYSDQTRDFAARSGLFQSARPTDIPPVDLNTPTSVLRRPKEPAATQPNPLRSSLALTGQALGKEMNIEMRYPRPVYYDADLGKRALRYRWALGSMLANSLEGPLAVLPSLYLEPEPRKAPRYAPEFLLTTSDSWNDPAPYPTRERRVPRFQRPKDDDPTRGTPDEMRNGPFPLGVAVEADIPDTWKDSYVLGCAAGPAAADAYTARVAERKTVRVVAIGHGSWFIDEKLNPAREVLLRDSCNWLLGRDEQLNHAAPAWSYPRVSMQRDEKFLWITGAAFGLPLLFAFLGILVLLARSVR